MSAYFADDHVFSRHDYRTYATLYAGELAGDFDLDAIADDLMEALGGASPDGMDADDFAETMQRHDVSGKE